MATGVEVAGLVLGSIPLILAGLQFYSEGIGVTKRYWKYKQEVISVLSELNAENAMYKNTINHLLVGIVKQNEMALLLTDPGGENWREKDFDLRLQKRLGTSYEAYLGTINQLMSTVEEFQDKLKLNKAFKPQFTEKNAFKEHYRRLKFSLTKSDYQDLMSKLQRANQSLWRLTMQTAHLAAVHQTADDSDRLTTPNFQIVKDHAESFYLALRNGWRCPCQADHTVNLRLESRTDDLRSHEGFVASTHDPFHVLFRYDQCSPDSSLVRPWTWEEADVRLRYDAQETSTQPSMSSQSRKGVRFAEEAIPRAVRAALEPHPNLQPIQDLCSAISALQKPQRDVCFSLLANEIAKQRNGVLLITPIKDFPSNTEAWSMSTLRVVLQDPKFSRQDRMKLAVTLASSVLQLHETPWLEEDWGKDSVFFINRPGEAQYDQPFVSQHFNQATQPASLSLPNRTSRIIRNQTLYALGVALIELYYKKPIADLRQDIDGPQKTGNASEDLLTEFYTADRLAEELLSEAGLRYSDAVRRCIHCDFDQRSRSLQDAKFQDAVYQGVVSQLQKDYQSLFDQAD